MKNLLKIFVVLLFSVTLVACGSSNDRNDNGYISPKPLETEIPSKEYTEDEYKELCKQVYNDYFFKEEPKVGDHIKVNVMCSTKYKYFESDMQGIITKEITKKYNLAMNCLGCTVMHESTKDDKVPNYFGKQIYIMFVNGSELNIDTFKTPEKIVIYGEVIQNENGIFVLPKYYEVEK